VSAANFNAPGQIVIAGHASAVARASAKIAAQDGRVVPLKVSAPFHCALMAPAAKVVEDRLRSVHVARPSFPIVANATAEPNDDPEAVKSLLVRQVDGPVRWEASVRFMHEAGITRALEIGPGKVLAGLGKRIAKEMKVLSLSDMSSLDQVEAFLAS
jgi:[acyl-carrier-protein] S-malonyltransferase